MLKSIQGGNVHTNSSLMGRKCDCKVTIELNIERSYLRKYAIERGNQDWQTVKSLLDLLGLEFKFVHVSILPKKKPRDMPSTR